MCKTQNHKQKIKSEEKQTNQEIFTHFDSTVTYSKGKTDLFNQLSMSSLKKKYKKRITCRNII